MRGFNIIELMIVVAIVGIFAALAIPAYHGYKALPGYSLTCYNNALEVTYMSPNDLYSRFAHPNEYGVWYLSDNSTYIQNSGDTCVATQVAEASVVNKVTVSNTAKVEK